MKFSKSADHARSSSSNFEYLWAAQISACLWRAQLQNFCSCCWCCVLWTVTIWYEKWIYLHAWSWPMLDRAEFKPYRQHMYSTHNLVQCRFRHMVDMGMILGFETWWAFVTVAFLMIDWSNLSFPLLVSSSEYHSYPVISRVIAVERYEKKTAKQGVHTKLGKDENRGACEQNRPSLSSRFPCSPHVLLAPSVLWKDISASPCC